MTNGSNGEDGFTLAEVLVSLAILAIMLTYTVQSFFYIGKAQEQADLVAAQAEVYAAADHMRQELSGAVPLVRMDDQSRPVVRFKGEPNSVEFVTLSPGDRETGGLMQVRYYVDDRNRFVSERRVLRDGVDVEPLAVVVLRAVDSMRIVYWSDASELPDWRDQTRLPTKVEVGVIMDTSSAAKWPVVQVRLESAGH